MVTENWAVFGLEDLTNGNASSALQLFVSSAAVRLLGRRASSNTGQRRTRTAEGFPRTTWDIGLIVFSFRDSASMYNPATDQDEISEFVSWQSIGPFPWLEGTWHFGPSGE